MKKATSSRDAHARRVKDKERFEQQSNGITKSSRRAKGSRKYIIERYL